MCTIIESIPMVMSMELQENEEFFLLLLRSFDFLRSDGYRITSFYPYGRLHLLEYGNSKNRQTITIEWAPSNYLTITIARSLLSGGGKFELKDIFRHFDQNSIVLESPSMLVPMADVIELNVKFIQQHLMPVIRGEMWIDRLLNKR